MATPLHSVAATGEGIAMSEAPLSFDGFFQDQYPRLFATMCLTTGSRSDAEELTQDAFVRVLERWDRVGGLQEPAGFLYRTAMNLFKRRYRRARMLDRLPIPSDPGDDAFAAIDNRLGCFFSGIPVVSLRGGSSTSTSERPGRDGRGDPRSPGSTALVAVVELRREPVADDSA